MIKAIGTTEVPALNSGNLSASLMHLASGKMVQTLQNGIIEEKSVCFVTKHKIQFL